MSRVRKPEPAFKVKAPRGEGETDGANGRRKYGWREEEGRKLKSWSLHPPVAAYTAMTIIRSARYEEGEDFTYSDLVREALDDWFQKHHDERHFGTEPRRAPPKED